MIKKLIEEVPRRNILVGLASALAVALPSQAQDSNAPTVLKPTVVTGSYIPTAETVTAAPVQTIGAAEIQKIAAQDVLELVKKVSPIFSGNGSTGQEVNNGGTGESYVQIRNLPTLVLINGHRLGNSSFSNGQLVDLNTIPLAAVERIEILKDGASALYGSEAEGGVVNIITKQNFSGVEVSGRYGAATGKGTFTEQRASIVGATTTERASFMAAAQYYHRDALDSRDRNIASMTYDQLASRNVDPTGVSYMSPSFPGKVSDSTGAYILRSSPLLQPFGLYDPTAPKSPPLIPNGTGGFKVFTGGDAVSQYNNDPYWATHGGSPYVADPGVVFQTTDLGTDSIQAQDRRNAFATGSYDLFEKRMQLYGEFLYANIDSEGKLAPSPVTGLGSKQSNIDIPADNLYNPFQTALGPSGGAAGLPPGGPRIRSRFWDSGNRLFDNQSDYYHFTGGLKGEFENGYGYDAAYNYNRYDQNALTRNAVNGAALDLALKPNVNPVLAAQGLSALSGPDGLPVPQYNIFSIPGQNDPRTLDAIRTTLFQVGRAEEWDAGGRVTGAPFELPGGKVGFAVGGGFTEESLRTDFDGLTQIGKVPGLNAAAPTFGRRRSWAGFAEVHIPLLSPDLNIPAFHSLEVTAAGRYESFDPGGDSAVPKIGVRWQPLDEQFTLRGSYAQSFVAPTTFQLFGGNQVNVPALSVPRTSAVGSPHAGLQEYEVNLSNSKLTPAKADTITAGIVISPKAVKNLTVSLDYYHIKTKNDIFRMSDQVMVNDINANGANSVWAPYFFKGNGDPVTGTAVNQANDQDWGVLNDPLLNGASIETDGFDLSANYMYDTEKYGRFSLYANANILLNYNYSDPFAGKFYYGGLYSDINTGDPGGQGLMPDWQLNLGLTWEYMNFTYNVNAQYIPQTGTASGQFFTLDGSPWNISSYYTIDMSVAYEFKAQGKWYDQTRLAVGCNNITDSDPPLIASAFEDNTWKPSYDIIGRFVYFEISKKF